MGPFLQSIDAGEVDGVLIQILQHISHEQDGDDAEIDLPQDPLGLCRIDFEISRPFKEGVIVVQMLRGDGRDLFDSMRGIFGGGWQDTEMLFRVTDAHCEGGYPNLKLDYELRSDGGVRRAV